MLQRPLGLFNLDLGGTSAATGARDAATASAKEEEHHVLHGDVWQVSPAEWGGLVAGNWSTTCILELDDLLS